MTLIEPMPGLLEEEGDLAGALALYKIAADQRSALGAFLVGWAMLHREWKVATQSVGLPRDPSVRESEREGREGARGILSNAAQNACRRPFGVLSRSWKRHVTDANPLNPQPSTLYPAL